MDTETNGKPTAEELARLRQLLLVDKGPSSRLQSYQFVYWRMLGDTLGQPFDMTKIPMSKLYQMRRDPMIAFALHYIKVPLIRAPWYIKCEDAQVAAFVDYALRKIYARLVLQYMLSLDFGFQAVVKRFELDKPVGTYVDPRDAEQSEKPIWSEGNVDAIVWKSFVPLPPEQVEPRWNNKGEFNGIRYDTKADIPLAFPTQKVFDRDDTVDVPLELSLWITNEKDSVFGSPWGYPRIGYAFRYWWSYWYRWALADRHFEKDADPPTVVRYPDDPNDESLDDNGNVIDYREVALSLGEQARSGSTIAMPSKLVMGMDDRISSVPQWDISYLEGGGNFDVFDKTFDRLEVLKLRSIWIPEQAFLEGSGGTSSRNVAAQLTDNFQESQAVLMGEFDDHLNRYVIPQLVRVNFPNFEGECKKVTKGFGPEDIDFAKNIVQLIGAKDPDSLEVDTRTLMDQIGIPLKSPEVVEAEREKKLQQAIEEAQAMQPPEVAPAPGQAGTVKRPSAGSATGFEISYIQPNESIVLAEDGFTSRLPDTNHYKDESILGITKATRRAWKNTYEEAYEDFAQFIGRTNFAEDDSEEDAEKEADRILSRWKYSFDNAVQATVGNVKKIIRRAGALELRRAKFSTENWNPNDAPAEWAERHGASLVKGVTETTRNELRRFLANEIRAGHTNDEIAKNIRDHFSAFPAWKADRLARTETMLAYNFATLFAGQAAGVTRVQALDGLRGPTEEDCENRNGKIFNIDDAFGENLKEHPNGTLAWRLLRSTNLSVEKVPRSEIEDDKLAWFDPITDTIYMAEDIDPDQEERYLCIIGETLA